MRPRIDAWSLLILVTAICGYCVVNVYQKPKHAVFIPATPNSLESLFFLSLIMQLVLPLQPHFVFTFGGHCILL